MTQQRSVEVGVRWPSGIAHRIFRSLPGISVAMFLRAQRLEPLDVHVAAQQRGISAETLVFGDQRAVLIYQRRSRPHEILRRFAVAAGAVQIGGEQAGRSRRNQQPAVFMLHQHLVACGYVDYELGACEGCPGAGRHR